MSDSHDTDRCQTDTGPFDLEAVAERFEVAWQKGDRPVIDDFLPRDADCRRELLIELVHTDLEFRLKAGEPVGAEAYLSRFPELGDNRTLLVNLIVAEYEWRLRRNEPITPEEYVKRFPQLGEDLHQLLPTIAPRRRRLPGATFVPTDGAQLPQLGRFQLLDEVGRGSFGTVYRARDVELDRIVAVKVPRNGQLLTAQDEDRFVREARSAAQLRHPGIVPVHEVSRSSEFPYIVSEFVDGTTLAEAISLRRFSFQEAAQLTTQVAEALDHAHRHGVIHRDLKPSNIMLDRQDDRPRLTDFGLARREDEEITVTFDGQIMGTPAYMSPEQASGQGHYVDGRTDVYSLGVILYVMLTGGLPFKGNPASVLDQVRNEPPIAPRRVKGDVPRDLETICLKCMEKEPARRYLSAMEVADEARRFLAGQPIRARPVGTIERFVRWSRREPRVASLIAAVFLSLVAGVGISTYFAIEAGNRAREAEQQVRVATALRLAVSARETLTHYPQRSLLLSVAAIAATLSKNEPPLPAAEQILRDGLATISGVPLVGHQAEVRFVVISPDNRWLVTASADQTLRLWNLTAEAPAASPTVLKCIGGELVSVTISPNSRWLVVGSADNAAQLWDLSAELPASGSTVLRGHEGTITSLSISADSHWLATGSVDQTARVWDLTVSDPARSPMVLAKHTSLITSLAFSHDSRWLVTGSEDTTARVWDLMATAPAETGIALSEHEEAIGSLAIGGDDRWIATGGEDRTARLWDLKRPGRSSFVLSDGDSQTSSVAFSPDGRWLATGSWTSPIGRENTVRIWRLSDADPSQRLFLLAGHQDKISSVSFAPDSRWLITGSEDTTAQLWDLRHEDPAASSLVLRGHEGWVTGLAVSADSRLLFTKAWDVPFRDLSVGVWDLTAPDPAAAPIFLRGHEEEITSLAVSPNHRWLVTGSVDKTARIWDLSTVGPAGPIPATTSSSPRQTSEQGDPLSLRLGTRHPDGTVSLVVPGSAPGGGREVLLRGHEGELTASAVSRDGRWAATGSNDKSVRLWRLVPLGAPAGPIVLRGHARDVVSLRFSNDAAALVSRSLDGVERTWNLQLDELLHQAKKTAGRELTEEERGQYLLESRE